MTKTVTILAMLLAGIANSSAAPFRHQGIYYEITSPSTVEVAEVPDSVNKAKAYEGDVVIPSEIEYEGKKYTVTALGVGSLCNTTHMTSVKLPETLDSIKQWAFTRSAITTLNIPKSVTYIGNYIASGCHATSITGMAGVKEFGNRTFYGMHDLKSVSMLPATLEIIPDNPFENCDNLATLIMNPMNPNFMTFWGCLYTKSKRKLISVPCALAQRVTDGKWSIPAEVQTIGKRAFTGNTTIITLTVPDNVKYIETEAFLNTAVETIDGFQGVEEIDEYGMEYSNFKSLKFGPALRKLGKSAFFGAKIQSVDMSNVVKLDTIGERAFAATDLTSICIPACVKFIAPGAINDNLSLIKVDVDPTSETYASRDNVIYSKDFKELCVFPGALKQDEFNVPAGVTTICDNAFQGAQFLTKVTLSEQCEKIGAQAFANAKRLRDVVYGESVRSVGKEAFASTKLAQFIIPANWEMGEKIFSSCDSLKTVEFENGRKEIPQETFYKCFNLSELTMPESLEYIGAAAFGDCFGLREIVVPDKVTTIGPWAFSMLNGPSGYTRLKKVVLGKSVKYIDEQCFAGTSFLEEVYSLNTTPPEMHDGFVPITFSEATLFVPGESLVAYQEAIPWMSFHRIRSIDSGVEEIDTTPADSVKVENGQIVVNSDAMVEVYSAAGRLVYSGRGCSMQIPGHGMYIVRVNGRSQKVML